MIMNNYKMSVVIEFKIKRFLKEIPGFVTYLVGQKESPHVIHILL